MTIDENNKNPVLAERPLDEIEQPYQESHYTRREASWFRKNMEIGALAGVLSLGSASLFIENKKVEDLAGASIVAYVGYHIGKTLERSYYKPIQEKKESDE